MAISASTAREKLFPLIEQVNQDLKPVLITSKNGNAVLISESEYESIIETNYLTFHASEPRIPRKVICSSKSRQVN
jgi:antitoxin YefM